MGRAGDGFLRIVFFVVVVVAGGYRGVRKDDLW